MTGQSSCLATNPDPVEYTEAQINAALSGGPTINTRDAVGHGTVSLGIAASNGRAFANGKYRGIAPEADLIVVKYTSEGAPAHGNQPPESFLVACFEDAMDWIDEKIDELGQPAVALGNFGVQYGPMDGTSAVSRKIDQIFGLDRPGRIWVEGVGDEGDKDNHAGGSYSNGADTLIPFSISDTATYRMSLWYDGNFPAQISVELSNGTVVGPITQGNAANQNGIFIQHYIPGTEFYEWNSTSGDGAVLIDVGGFAGTGNLRIRSTIPGTGTFDAYGPFSDNLTFTNLLVPGRMADIGTTKSAITLGAYVNKVDYVDIDGVPRTVNNEGLTNEVWTGSSQGPTRDGRLGVDVMLPGHNLFASFGQTSYWTTFRSNLVEDGGGFYGRQGAVSGAAPILQGAVALMLQVNPELTARQAREIIRETAVRDSETGSAPNTQWGYGKMDVYAAAMEATGQANAPRLLSVVPDTNNNGADEVAAIQVNDTASIRVRMSDANTGGILGNYTFFSKAWARPQVFTIPDAAPGDTPALAVFANRQSDNLPGIQIKNAATGTGIRNVFPWSAAWEVLAVDVIPGAASGGRHAIAVLAKRRSDGLQGIELRDPGDGSRIKILYPLGFGWTPQQFVVMTVNGQPAVAVLNTRDADGLAIVQIRDVASGGVVKNVFPLGLGWSPRELRSVPDLNGNGADEVAVRMTRDTDGLEIIQLRDGLTNALISNVYPIGAGSGAWRTQQFLVLDNNGTTELAIVSSRDSDGQILMQTKNAVSAAISRNTFYLGTPWRFDFALLALPDFSGNGATEVGVLTENRTNKSRLVQVRDGANGSVIRNVAQN
ncbi:MAG: S8 family serine peptidase [Pseudomonadota bacterium]